jgi:SPOR domain
MGNFDKRHPVEVRFSPLSLICLLFCWVGVSGLAFYGGILVGRMEQMREVRRLYTADESAVAEEKIPHLSFEENLGLPEMQGDGIPASVEAPRASKQSSAPEAQGSGAERKVLQVASFQKPEHAEHLVRVLREKGYPCFQRLPDPNGSGDGYCRVFVGPLPSEKTALEMKERLERQEGCRGVLIRSVREKEAQF